MTRQILRVRRHQRDGDFERYGYLPGKELDPEASAGLAGGAGAAVSSSAETMLKYLSPEIQVTRMGLKRAVAAVAEGRLPAVARPNPVGVIVAVKAS